MPVCDATGPPLGTRYRRSWLRSRQCRRRSGGGRLTWTGKTPSVVWNQSGLTANLAAILERRTVDWLRFGGWESPWHAWCGAPPDAVAAFLYGELNDDKIADLLWGLILCRIPAGSSAYEGGSLEGEPLSRAYAVLKLFFQRLPVEERRELLPDAAAGGVTIHPGDYEQLRQLRPDPRLLRLIVGNRIAEALDMASQALRAMQLRPAPINWEREGLIFPPKRLVAALLIPLSDIQTVRLWRSIARSHPDESLSLATET